MESLMWVVLFASLLIASAVGLARIEPEVTAYAGAVNTVLSAILSYGAMNYTVVSNGAKVTVPHPGVAILLFLQTVFGLVILVVGVIDYYDDIGDDGPAPSDLPDAIANDRDAADIPTAGENP